MPALAAAAAENPTSAHDAAVTAAGFRRRGVQGAKAVHDIVKCDRPASFFCVRALNVPQPKTWPPSGSLFCLGRRRRGQGRLRRRAIPGRKLCMMALAPRLLERMVPVRVGRKISSRRREVGRRGPRRKHMRKPACGLVLTFVMVGSSTGAQAGPWCAFYDSTTYNCGSHSYAQCYATIYGNGGWCRQNFFEPSGRDGRSGKTRPPARY
jgi:hypothetical protein